MLLLAALLDSSNVAKTGHCTMNLPDRFSVLHRPREIVAELFQQALKHDQTTWPARTFDHIFANAVVITGSR